MRDRVEDLSESSKPVFVTAVTTINRIEYLKSFVNTWMETKSRNAESLLVVADDGSTDGTLEWLTEDLDIGVSGLYVIRNNGTGIARQSNSILNAIADFDFPIDAFSCVMMILDSGKLAGTMLIILQCYHPDLIT